ncbi:hypothetical protein QCE62_00455 [Caballeronia sp. LZ033]|uniref:hypothetical protein n=1 Tax=Caballeronia sp. LZ033 TaxID=3038566 RepID=UPI002862116D|nr:hypothetical protein [Caballeronia sp. LZ033]MDR5812057.1 hypothetical protein [Caballeronia sp. LZ033]
MMANYEDQSARQTRAAFLSLLEAQGWRYQISWRWNRRSRDGVVKVEGDGGDLIAELGYFRNTQTWSATDGTLYRLRTGSAKHQALLCAIDQAAAAGTGEAVISGRTPSDREYTTDCVAHGRVACMSKPQTLLNSRQAHAS